MTTPDPIEEIYNRIDDIIIDEDYNTITTYKLNSIYENELYGGLDENLVANNKWFFNLLYR